MLQERQQTSVPIYSCHPMQSGSFHSKSYLSFREWSVGVAYHLRQIRQHVLKDQHEPWPVRQDLTQSDNMLAVNLLQCLDLAQSRVRYTILQPLQRYLQTARRNAFTSAWDHRSAMWRLLHWLFMGGLYDTWYMGSLWMGWFDLSVRPSINQSTGIILSWSTEGTLHQLGCTQKLPIGINSRYCP